MAAIEQAVLDSDVVVVLVGRDWPTAPVAGRDTWLDDPDDPLRVTVRIALTSGRRLVPVVLDGASYPRGACLPDDVAGLARLQSVALSGDSSLDEVLVLVRRLLAG